MNCKKNYSPPYLYLHLVTTEDTLCVTSNYNLIDPNTPGALQHSWTDEEIIDLNYQTID